MLLNLHLPNILQLTGLTAHRGYISQDGEYTEDSSKKMPLKDLCQNTIDQVFEMLGQPMNDQVEGNRRLINGLLVNFTALRKRYESETTLFERNLVSPGIETVRKIDRLFQVLKATDQLLECVVAQRTDFSKAFDDLVGEEWDRLAVLMKPMEKKEIAIEPLDRELIDWSTKRSLKWLGVSLFSSTNISKEAVWKVLPHLDFFQISCDDLKKIEKLYLRPEAPERTENWHALSAVLCKLGLAMIANGDAVAGRKLAIEGLLMVVCEDHAFVQKTLLQLISSSFPHNMLEYNFHGLILASYAGLLQRETIPEGLDFQHILLEPLQAEVFYPLDAGSFPLHMAIFILRQHEMHHLSNYQEAHLLYTALISSSKFFPEGFLKPENLEPHDLHGLYIIYNWYCDAPKFSKMEMGLLYPALIAFCDRIVVNQEQGYAFRLFKAFSLCRMAMDCERKEKMQFIGAVYLEASFSSRPSIEAIEGLKHLSPRWIGLLKEWYPYVYNLRLQAELNPRNSSMHNGMFALTHTYKPTLHKTEKEPTMDDIALSVAGGRKLRADYGNKREWIQWLSADAMMSNHHFVNLAGRRDIDDGWLVHHPFNGFNHIVDLTDTCVTLTGVFELCRSDRSLNVIYADHITPALKLLALNNGEYALQYEGGIRHVHEALVREVAPVEHQLKSDEVDLFLEYCYTHQISSLTFSLASRLLIQAAQQNWKGIGEYCLTYLIGSTNYTNLIERIQDVPDHPALAPYRYFCVRLCVQGLRTHQFDRYSQEEQEFLKEVEKRIVHGAVEIPAPPPFVPVDLRKALPEHKVVICDDGTEVSINLLMMSLHSGHFQNLLNFGGKDVLEDQPMHLLDISGDCIQFILDFVHTGKLPESLAYLRVLELCLAASYLEMPALKIALLTLLKRAHYVDTGLDRHALRKLGLYALGFDPKATPKVLVSLFNASRRYNLSYLQGEIAKRLNVPEHLIAPLIQFSLDEKRPTSLDDHQLRIFYHWAYELNLTSWLVDI